jgi:hypothetical protein
MAYTLDFNQALPKRKFRLTCRDSFRIFEHEKEYLLGMGDHEKNAMDWRKLQRIIFIPRFVDQAGTKRVSDVLPANAFRPALDGNTANSYRIYLRADIRQGNRPANGGSAALPVLSHRDHPVEPFL